MSISNFITMSRILQSAAYTKFIHYWWEQLEYQFSSFFISSGITVGVVSSAAVESLIFLLSSRSIVCCLLLPCCLLLVACCCSCFFNTASSFVPIFYDNLAAVHVTAVGLYSLYFHVLEEAYSYN